MFGGIFQRDESHKTIVGRWIISIVLREGMIDGVFVPRKKGLGTSYHAMTSGGHILSYKRSIMCRGKR